MNGEVVEGYLAHPVLARKEVREWELQFEKDNPDVDLINPFQEIERESEPHLMDSEAGDYTSVDPARLVAIDLKAMHRCDFLVAWVTGQRSYGTIMEIVYAYAANKPVYIICTNGHETHPWLRYHATKIFTAPWQFERYMRYHHGPRS
jgi:nucleoside 2-deoxyribosyltransferase